MRLTSVEMCAGAGGQALGLEMAKFKHIALVDNDVACCATLRLNRPAWNVIKQDLKTFDGHPFAGVDLLAGGLPCPPFSVAGLQLGAQDPRDLFPTALRLVDETKPKAVMIENVRGFLAPRFEPYRKYLKQQLRRRGYVVGWKEFDTSDFGVPQARHRVIIVALKRKYSPHFRWPRGTGDFTTVGEALFDLIGEAGWRDAKKWKKTASVPAPTIVGGSKKHGGADLGPSRSRAAWLKLGINGSSLAEAPPDRHFKGPPRLTIPMVQRIQGFPDNWAITGSKTEAYRQVGNALPPALAKAIGEKIRLAIIKGDNQRVRVEKITKCKTARIPRRSQQPKKIARKSKKGSGA